MGLSAEQLQRSLDALARGRTRVRRRRSRGRLSRAAHPRPRLRDPAAHDRRPAGQRRRRPMRSGGGWRQRSAPDSIRSMLAATPDEKLRAAGLSRQKIGYARSLAERGGERAARSVGLPADDEEAIAELVADQGHRPLVGGDLPAVRRRARRHLAGGRSGGADRGRRSARPARAAIGKARRARSREAWRPHRGAAAIFAWHHYGRRLAANKAEKAGAEDKLPV